eukprot:6658479-Pyramimonas_sp.AAC.1
MYYLFCFFTSVCPAPAAAAVPGDARAHHGHQLRAHGRGGAVRGAHPGSVRAPGPSQAAGGGTGGAGGGALAQAPAPPRGAQPKTRAGGERGVAAPSKGGPGLQAPYQLQGARPSMVTVRGGYSASTLDRYFPFLTSAESPLGSQVISFDDACLGMLYTSPTSALLVECPWADVVAKFPQPLVRCVRSIRGKVMNGVGPLGRVAVGVLCWDERETCEHRSQTTVEWRRTQGL